VQEAGVRERLVGFTLPADALPKEGAQVVVDGASAGRVTSARLSERLGCVVGLAWVRPELAADEGEIAIGIDRSLQRARVTLAPFFDPEGARLRS
jgi:glycine cleavage system aminomethyltransferase T